MNIFRWISLSVIVVLCSLTESAAQQTTSASDWNPRYPHLHLRTNSVTPKNNNKMNSYFSNQFPSLKETLEMAKLSGLVYGFKLFTPEYAKEYCKSYHQDGIRCHWYHHDLEIGTQVMLVSNFRKKYIAIVFAGTDDLRTSLEDADVFQKPFGNNQTGVSLNDPTIKVHAGFDNAVFARTCNSNNDNNNNDKKSSIYQELLQRLRTLRIRYFNYRLWATGHSLGAANAILTATALAYQEGYKVTCVNFGCPQTGNFEWKQFHHNHNSNNNNNTITNEVVMADKDDNELLHHRLSVWRVVLGWDLVPRLPEFFFHVGHTIQIWNNSSRYHGDQNNNAVEYHHDYDYLNYVDGYDDEYKFMTTNWQTASQKDSDSDTYHDDIDNNDSASQLSKASSSSSLSSPSFRVEAYYEHYGDEQLGYASVPPGWSYKPYVWVPGALLDHICSRYIDALETLLLEQEHEQEKEGVWVQSFQKIEPVNNLDDDTYDEPPDDYLMPEYAE